MARRPQTPKEKKQSGIILLMFAAIILLAGCMLEVQSRNLKTSCTATVSGVVSDVDSKRVRSKRSSHTEYRSRIKVEDSALSGSSELLSVWTRTHYRTGDFITVYYNPEKPSQHYVSGDVPQSVLGMILVGLIIAGAAVFMIKQGADELKQSQDW